MALTLEDVTDTRDAQQRLRRSEHLRRLAGGLARVGGWALDCDRTVYWSDEVYAIIDAPAGDETPWDVIMERYPADSRARLEAAIAACFATGDPFDLEIDIDTFAGRRIPVRVLAEAQYDADGTVTQVIGAVQDLAEVQEAAHLAEEAGRRLVTTLQSMTDAIFTLDRSWQFTYLNPRAEELLQRTRGELLGRSIWDEFPEAVGSQVYDAYQRAMAGDRTQVIEAFWYAPLETWFAIHAYPSQQGLAVYFRDVTASQVVRRELEAREAVLARQAALLDEAQDAILVRDVDHRITYWSRGAERVYGWHADEVMGRDMRTLLYDHPAAFDAATHEVFTTGAWSGELVQLDRHGDRIVVTARWTLVSDDEGRPEAVLAINTDITEQQRVEQQLLRAQRMESIGTLAGGVAHDLNNVLSPILLATDLLEGRALGDDSEMLLDTIATSARRGAELVGQVLSFARGVDGQRVPVDVGGLLRDIGATVRDTFPKGIELRLDTHHASPAIIGDGTQIQQVLLNLAVNARDAMPDGGTLTIRSSEVDLDPQYVAATPGTSPGRYLLVEVEDTGTGMLPEVRDRVFEPFFTTKHQGAGTGLGLSTSLAIVRSHEGFLRVYSEPGHGSRFSLHLPLDAANGQQTLVMGVVADLPRGRGQLVLVVDDEAAVRAMTRQTLEAHGYRALEAANGAEALSVFAQHLAEVDVVLTDMMMPIMDGPATIHALRSLAPEVRIIAASGLHGPGKAAKASSAGAEHFLPKPHTSRRLLELLDEVLSAGT